MYIEKTYKHKIDEEAIILDIHMKMPQDDTMQTGFIVLFGSIIIVIAIMCIFVPYAVQEGFPFSLSPLLFLIPLLIPIGLILVGRHQKRHPKPPSCYRKIYTFDKRRRMLRVEKGPLVGEGQEFDNRKYKIKEIPFDKIHSINLESTGSNNRIFVGFVFDGYCVHEGKDATEAANLQQELLRLRQVA